MEEDYRLLTKKETEKQLLDAWCKRVSNTEELISFLTAKMEKAEEAYKKRKQEQKL